MVRVAPAHFPDPVLVTTPLHGYRGESAAFVARPPRCLTVVITHIKPTLLSGPTSREQITAQLRPLQSRLARLIVPDSGQRIDL